MTSRLRGWCKSPDTRVQSPESRVQRPGVSGQIPDKTLCMYADHGQGRRGRIMTSRLTYGHDAFVSGIDDGAVSVES